MTPEVKEFILNAMATVTCTWPVWASVAILGYALYQDRKNGNNSKIAGNFKGKNSSR